MCQVISFLVRRDERSQPHPFRQLAFAFCKVKFANFSFWERAHTQWGWWRMCTTFSRCCFRWREKSIKRSFPGNVNKHSEGILLICVSQYGSVGTRTWMAGYFGTFLWYPLVFRLPSSARWLHERKSRETTGKLHRIYPNKYDYS